ncbi:hypothetical protein HD554DRAFT_1759385 [Boletus coccyginus]|nr:hypothetical protein HD554DRAFT_1759385 [Boletus coccyginus]
MVDWAFGTNMSSEYGPTNAITGGPMPIPTGHDCVICQDPIHGAEIRAPCGDYYDIACITDLFQSATRDESLFPPRCCRQNIPLAQVQPHLTQTLITTFQQKQAELSTLKRVYCSSPTCSLFLGPVSERIFGSKVYTCPAPGCGRRTCGICREEHNGYWSHACNPDANATQVLELSRTSGWARCPGCSQMIELNIGCFHMICRCRTEFCYVCQARWKTCQCPQWDERRLLAAAEERVDAQLGERRDAPVGQAVPAAVPVPANRAPVAMPVRPPVRTPPPPPPQPIPAHTPTASSSTGRPVSTASTLPREGANRRMRGWWGLLSALGFPRLPASRASASQEPNPMRQCLVREMVEQLRVNHGCDHTRWRHRWGGGTCQSCGHKLLINLFRCQGCEKLACKRCRHNRL